MSSDIWAQFEQPTLTDDVAKFMSMSHVLAGIRSFDLQQAPTGDPLVNIAVTASQRPFRRSVAIPKDAAQLLRVSWQTELAARVGDQLDEPGLRQASLQTLPVQVYYAIFSAARALTIVAGAAKSSHAHIHNIFQTEHIRRTAGAMEVTITGDPELPDACTIKPSICQPAAVNPIESGYASADYVWAALRMARRWQCTRKREDWLNDKQNRTRKGTAYKRLPPGARAQIVESMRPTTMLDFIYELRCATNYQSIDEYAATVDDRDVLAFHHGLLHLLQTGLQTYETQIALYAGASRLKDQQDDWTRRVAGLGSWTTATIEARMQAITSAIR